LSAFAKNPPSVAAIMIIPISVNTFKQRHLKLQRTEIKKLHKTLKTTMVYVTHDQTEAMTMGDRIAVMKDGIIHQLDTPLNVYNNPAD